MKTIGYQRDRNGNYVDNLIYVSLVDANRTKQLIETAQLYGGLRGDDGVTLNHSLLRKQTDISKLGAKLLILGVDRTMDGFHKLRQIQIASMEIYGGQVAESLVSLEVKKAWPDN